MAQITEAEARLLAQQYLDNADADFLVTLVQDAGPFWKVAYNSRLFVETGEAQHALAGNHPLLVDKGTGSVEPDSALLPVRHPNRIDARVVAPRVQRRIERDFASLADAAQVGAIVAELSDTERIQAAVVICAAGSIESATEAADLARVDWRDLLMNADLADADWPHRLFDELGPKD